jgi:hypothetical protein
MNKVLIFILILAAISTSAGAQSKQAEPYVVPARSGACEVNAAAFDSLANTLLSDDERLFIVARLGTGETSRELNRRRLHNVRTYFKDGWPQIDAKRFIFTEGDKVNGEGRVEFYVGSALMQISLVHRGGDICVDCCEYPDNRYYGMGRKDKSTRRNR